MYILFNLNRLIWLLLPKGLLIDVVLDWEGRHRTTHCNKLLLALVFKIVAMRRHRHCACCDVSGHLLLDLIILISNFLVWRRSLHFLSLWWLWGLFWRHSFYGDQRGRLVWIGGKTFTKASFGASWHWSGHWSFFSWHFNCLVLVWFYCLLFAHFW